jgi:hypothetical protein
MIHTVFICHDYMLVEVLDEIQARLEQSGVEVLRGPQTAPGKKLVYSKGSYTELFGRAEVMMFSSRSICPILRQPTSWASSSGTGQRRKISSAWLRRRSC